MDFFNKKQPFGTNTLKGMTETPSENAGNHRFGNTLIVVLGCMALAALVTLAGAINTVRSRRARDVPATSLPEAGLLNLLPGNTHQVLAGRPGWQKHLQSLQKILPSGLAGPGATAKPGQWAAGWHVPGESLTVVADFATGSALPQGWHFSQGVWFWNRDVSKDTQNSHVVQNSQAVQKIQASQSGQAGWAPGLALVVQNRLPSQALVWAAGVGTPWPEGIGSQLWQLGASGALGKPVTALFPKALTWVVWLEDQPERLVMRAEVECASPGESTRVEKALEAQQKQGLGNLDGLRFLADGPWISLQYSLSSSNLGPNQAGR